MYLKLTICLSLGGQVKSLEVFQGDLPLALMNTTSVHLGYVIGGGDTCQVIIFIYWRRGHMSGNYIYIGGWDTCQVIIHIYWRRGHMSGNYIYILEEGTHVR